MEQAAIDFATFQKFQAIISPSLYLAVDSTVLRKCPVRGQRELWHNLDQLPEIKEDI